MSCEIAVFLKPVVEGRVKTRLAAAVGSRAATALYRAFVADSLAQLAQLARMRPVEVRLWVAGDPDHPSLRDLDGGFVRCAQPPGDLGQRQERALQDGLGRHRQTLCIGTDLPTLPSAHVLAALDGLREHPGVVGPTADGGYYLLGLSRPCPEGLLTGVRWSSPRTLGDTRAKLAAHGIAPVDLPPHYDVDDAEDLRLLQTHLHLDPAAAPQTWAALAQLGLR